MYCQTPSIPHLDTYKHIFARKINDYVPEA